jgi:hypothetical protein
MQANTPAGLDNWIVPLALKALRHAMTTECDRLTPDFFKIFPHRSDAATLNIDFEDPSIKEFLGMLSFPVGVNLSVQSIDHLVRVAAAEVGSSFNFWKHLNPSIQALHDLRPDNGWCELDKLLVVCCGRSWSHFVDSVQLIRHPLDTDLGASTAYRVMFMTGDDDFATNVIDWFAAASDMEYLAPILEMIESGVFTVVDSYRPGPVMVKEIRVIKNEQVMIYLPVAHIEAESLAVDWRTCDCATTDMAFYEQLISFLPPEKSVLLKARMAEVFS